MIDLLGIYVALTIGYLGLPGFMIVTLAVGFAVGYFVGSRP